MTDHHNFADRRCADRSGPQARAPEQVTPDARPVPFSAPAQISTHPSHRRREKGKHRHCIFDQDDGIWFTARHVVDGCDRVGLQVDQRRAAKVQKVQSHPKSPSCGRAAANLASRSSAPLGSISPDITSVIRKEAGRSSSLIGRRNMRTIGRYRHTEPVVAWVERARHP